MLEIKILNELYLIDTREIIFVEISDFGTILNILFKNGSKAQITYKKDDISEAFASAVNDIKKAYNKIKEGLKNVK